MKDATALAKRGLAAGLLAALVATGFHMLWTEPLIEEAVKIEQQRAPGDAPAHEPPVVSRAAQKGGLMLGFLLYGAVWGLFLGLFAALTRWWIPLPRGIGQGLLLAAMLGLAVAVFPFLKYPANPPGVEARTPVGERQEAYLVGLGLSVAGLLVALRLYRAARQRRPHVGGMVIPAYATYLGVLYWMLPADPTVTSLPETLVWQFRAASFAGLLLFWGSLGTVFGWFCRHPWQAS